MKYGTRTINDEYVQTSIIPRLVENTSERDENGCLLWTGCCGRRGYSKMAIVDADGNTINARPHRIVAILFFGDIGESEVDHLCRNVRCINVRHLEPVTGKENLDRMHKERRRERYKHQVKMPWGEL